MPEPDGQRLATRTGIEWFERFMVAQASVQSNVMWLVFVIGQAGVAIETDPAIAKKMVEQMEQDVVDLEQAAAELAAVCRDMLANAARNLENVARLSEEPDEP